jgi:glycosyltransferase involved in cell wall biosynthesis
VHLTALVESAEHVCCRYRIAAFRPHLERAGHTLELRPLPRPWWSWFRLGRELRHADAVVLQRKLPQRWQLFLLRRAARRLLFDFDDAVFLRDSYAPRGLHSAVRRRRFAAVVRSADAVVPGNDFLRAAAGPARAFVIPTCVEPSRYPCAEHRRAGKGVQLVWVGSSSTLRGLEAVRPLLERLGQRLPGLRLKLICDRFLSLAHLLVLPCAWTESCEPGEIAAADIGISWLPDDDWSRGKCGLKVLQYMAAGLPVVANPVGVQAELVRHGETGFLATTPDEWTEAVARLAGDPALRRRLGSAGRQRVASDFSVAAGAARWIALLEELRHGRTAGQGAA